MSKTKIIAITAFIISLLTLGLFIYYNFIPKSIRLKTYKIPPNGEIRIENENDFTVYGVVFYYKYEGDTEYNSFHPTDDVILPHMQMHMPYVDNNRVTEFYAEGWYK